MADIDQLYNEVKELRKDFHDFQLVNSKEHGETASRLVALDMKSHNPGDCKLGTQVKTLQLHEAKQNGVLAVIGVIATGAISVLLLYIKKIVG